MKVRKQMRNKFYSRLNARCSEQSEIDHHAMNAERIKPDADIGRGNFKSQIICVAVVLAIAALAIWVAR